MKDLVKDGRRTGEGATALVWFASSDSRRDDGVKSAASISTSSEHFGALRCLALVSRNTDASPRLGPWSAKSSKKDRVAIKSDKKSLDGNVCRGESKTVASDGAPDSAKASTIVSLRKPRVGGTKQKANSPALTLGRVTSNVSERVEDAASDEGGTKGGSGDGEGEADEEEADQTRWVSLEAQTRRPRSPTYLNKNPGRFSMVLACARWAQLNLRALTSRSATGDKKLSARVLERAGGYKMKLCEMRCRRLTLVRSVRRGVLDSTFLAGAHDD